MIRMFVLCLVLCTVASAPSNGEGVRQHDPVRDLVRRMIELEAKYEELKTENAELRSFLAAKERVKNKRQTNEVSDFPLDIVEKDAKPGGTDEGTVSLRRKVTLQGKKIDQLTENESSLEKRIRDLEQRASDDESMETNQISATQAMIMKGESLINQMSYTLSNISKKCAFSGVRTQLLLGDGSQSQIVTYDEQNANKGKDFDVDTGTFTCEVPGIYYFSFSVRTYDSYSIGLTLVKNNEPTVSMKTDGDAGTRDVMQSQSVMLDLVAGDQVWLQLGPHDDYAIYSSGTSKYITFNGFVIYPNMV